MQQTILRKIQVPAGSALSESDYADFLRRSYQLMTRYAQYFAPEEDVNSVELAHLLPSVPETVIALYLAINDAVCNKALVSPFLIRHGHNNVFVFDPEVYAGGDDVPAGCVDARKILNGFQTPNDSWNSDWTYVMIEDPARRVQSLWQQKGYIDMIPAKFEDFTMLSESDESRLCIFVDPNAFEHPVNRGREYLKQARQRGEEMVDQFTIPASIAGEAEGLAPVILARGEKLYVATIGFGPCAHAWSNLHPDNTALAVVNENSAVPLDLITAKPPVATQYGRGLIPPRGSTDMTTDWFYRGRQVVRPPLLSGSVKG